MNIDVPCCDICAPQLLDTCRPGVPKQVLDRQTAPSEGSFNKKLADDLQEWRARTWEHKYGVYSGFGSHAVLPDPLITKIALLKNPGAIELKTTLKSSWAFWDTHGEEIVAFITAGSATSSGTFTLLSQHTELGGLSTQFATQAHSQGLTFVYTTEEDIIAQEIEREAKAKAKADKLEKSTPTQLTTNTAEMHAVSTSTTIATDHPISSISSLPATCSTSSDSNTAATPSSFSIAPPAILHNSSTPFMNISFQKAVSFETDSDGNAVEVKMELDTDLSIDKEAQRHSCGRDRTKSQGRGRGRGRTRP